MHYTPYYSYEYYTLLFDKYIVIKKDKRFINSIAMLIFGFLWVIFGNAIADGDPDFNFFIF